MVIVVPLVGVRRLLVLHLIHTKDMIRMKKLTAIAITLRAMRIGRCGYGYANKCGCYGAHFGAYCQGQVRPDYDPKADPRKANTPIEAYPSNRIEAMHRCKQEYRK